jgi:pantetheine-phosphate adenylyltransferase
MSNNIKATVALLPGSYDPITNGHMDVIRRAATLFDRVIVAVMTNDMRAYVADAKVKQYMFTMEERTEMARLACAELSNVRVISSTARLIDLVDELEADVIVKGVRNEVDYAYEQHHALYNRAHNPRAETLYLPADPAFDHISSTLVRERIAAGERTEDILPPKVAAYIQKRGE